MKQFIICILLSLLLYVLSSFVGQSFNPMEWSSTEGRFWFCFFQILIWLIPICLNFLNMEENFK